MKIGQPADKAVGTPAASEPKTKANAKTDGAAGAAATPASSASAKVKLSDAVSGLLAGKELTSEVFDAAKVDRLATAIAQGSFVVDPAAVADKLIANALELLGKKSH
jgi:negative regulator of flagellin synthesis FlgM